MARFYGETMTDLEEIKADVKMILKLINGNGKLGIAAKVNIMWATGLFLVISVVGLLLRTFILK